MPPRRTGRHAGHSRLRRIVWIKERIGVVRFACRPHPQSDVTRLRSRVASCGVTACLRGSPRRHRVRDVGRAQPAGVGLTPATACGAAHARCPVVGAVGPGVPTTSNEEWQRDGSRRRAVSGRPPRNPRSAAFSCCRFAACSTRRALPVTANASSQWHQSTRAPLAPAAPIAPVAPAAPLQRLPDVLMHEADGDRSLANR